MIGTSRPNRLNPTDATLWQIERDPLLRTTIVGLALLAGRPDWDDLVSAIAVAIDRLPRLRQRIAEGPLGFGRPHWVESEADLSHHLLRTRVDDASDLRSLLEVAGVMATEEFDRSRPLWQLHLIDDAAGDHAALLLKVSHTITDGVGGVSLLRIFDDQPFGSITIPERDPADSPSLIDNLINAPFDLTEAALRASLHPFATASSVLDLVGSALHLMAPAGPPLSPLMTARGTTRWAGVTEFPLERLRSASHRAGGTMNDAFVTIAIGALDDYHRALGTPSDAFRVTMPVDIRGRDDAEGGNQWAPARLVLRPGVADHPFESLRSHQSTITRAIHEPAIPFIQPLAAAVQQLPDALTLGIVAGMVKGSDVVLTNVPGLRRPLKIAGAEVTRFFPFAPAGGAALSIALMSHLDTACIGFTIDADAVEAPDLIVQCFDERADDFIRRRKAPASIADPSTVAASTGSASAQPERLSALDTSFLRMESISTPMHMGGLFVIEGGALLDADGRLDLEEVRRHVDRRLQSAPRLRKKLREVPFGIARPVWVDDPAFDIANHVHRRTLASPGTRTQLIEACEHIQMAPLDRFRPLFDLTFFDGLDPETFGPGAIALVDRVHHALLDGVSGVEMIELLFDASPGGSKSPGARPTASTSSVVTSPTSARPTTVHHDGDTGNGQPRQEPSSLGLVADAVVERLGEPLTLTRRAIQLATDPLRAARLATSLAGSVGNLFGHDAGGISFNADVGRHRLLRTVTVSLAEVHDTGERLGGSVNDTVLTAVAAGVGALLHLRNERFDEPFFVLVPVSMRHRGLAVEPGNHVAAMVVELPVVGDVGSMFKIVSDRIEQHKRRHRAMGSESLLDAGDHLPSVAIDLAARAAHHQRSANMVVTNVRGPSTPLYFHGGKVSEIVPIVPLGGNLTVGVAVLSYNGELVLSFHADSEACPDVDVMVDAARTAFDDLVSLAAPQHSTP